MLCKSTAIMPSGKARPDLLDPEISTFAVAGLAVTLLLLWRGSHRLKHYARKGWQEWAFFVCRVALGTLALWATSQFLARFFALTTSWAIWIPSIVAAIAMELVVCLYALERKAVQRRDGKIMVLLRLGAVGALFLMLLQPVLSWDSEHEFGREIVVLIDDSESMQIVDENLSSSEN